MTTSRIASKANFHNLTPSQQLIVQVWDGLRTEPKNWRHGVGEDTRYMPEDYITAKRCGVSVEKVGEALVAAGRRPVLWWVG